MKVSRFQLWRHVLHSGIAKVLFTCIAAFMMLNVTSDVMAKGVAKAAAVPHKASQVPDIPGKQEDRATAGQVLDAGKKLSFIENKGQVTDQFHKPRHDIQFSLAAANGLNIFIGDGAIHYQFSKVENHFNPSRSVETQDFASPYKGPENETPDSITCTMYRMDVELVGSNKNAEIVSDERQAYYENYYTTSTCGDGATAHAFNRITYKEVYPHIDWVLYTSDGQLKHEFHVREGGNVRDIKLKYSGEKDLHIDKNGALIVSTPQGTITEQAPYSYQTDGTKVNSHFKLTGSTLSYEAESYKGTLVIDPGLVWATYYGGSGRDRFYSMAGDSAGYLYATGPVWLTTTLATSGVHQTTFAGAYDAILVKFNAEGGRVCATYFGGTQSDISHAVAVDRGGNVYIGGETGSTSGIATAGAFQTGWAGGGGSVQDAFLAKFSSSGMRIWGTYFGGTLSEICYSLAIDSSCNIYIGGFSNGAGLPATSGSHQPAFGGGTNDGFLAKFDSSGMCFWATYFGGSNNDYVRSVAVDEGGNAYITGITSSFGGIASPGGYQSTYGGSGDGFLAKFSGSGVRIWGTYYGGSSTDDGYTVTIDDSANVLVAGFTSSTSGIASTGAFQGTIGGAGDAFLAKFNETGSRIWASYFGGSSADYSLSVIASRSGDIYVSGPTMSNDGIATVGAYQSTKSSGFDAYLAKFDRAGVRKWATYFGGPGGQEGGFSVVTDNLRYVYIAGYTESTSGIATAGAFQATHAGGTDDAFLAKFSLDCLPDVTSVTPNIAYPGATVTILGNQFNEDSAKNIVFFGATRAAVTSASSTSLAVTVPIGATYMPVSVTNSACALTGYAPAPFLQSYDTSLFEPGVVNFDTMMRYYSGSMTGGLALSDIDGDGKADIIVATATSTGIDSVFIYRNVSLPGMINQSSFAQRVGFALPVGYFAKDIEVADIDCDGRPDILAISRVISGNNIISVFRNIASPGSITQGSFQTRFDFTTFARGWDIAIGDLDKDGRPDIVSANWDYNTVSVFRNTSEPGIINSASFAPAVNFDANNSMSLAIGDIDADGKPEIITVGTAMLTILKNTCTPGIIDTASFAPKVSISTYIGPHRPPPLADLDDDGQPDLVNAFVGEASVRKNICTSGVIGTSSFATPVDFMTDSNPYHCVVGDINGNGKPDIVVSTSGSGAGTVSVLCNKGAAGVIDTGTFAPRVDFLINPHADRIGIGDLDGDAVPDIAAALWGNYGVGVLRNNRLRKITGITTVCVGGTTTLSCATSGGTWVSLSPGIATIDTVSGVVTGVATGTTTIIYAVPTGSTSVVVTVNLIPYSGTISGPPSICIGGIAPYTASVSGGIWSSSDTSVFTVNNVGLVTGVSTGFATISYSADNACGSGTTLALINVFLAITDPGIVSGPSSVCAGSTIMLSDAVSGGTWSSSNALIANVGSSGIVSGMAAGTAIISYTVNTGCGDAVATAIVTVNPSPYTNVIIGPSAICVGDVVPFACAPPGGVWSTSDGSVAGIDAIGVVSGVAGGVVFISYSVSNSCGIVSAVTALTVDVSPPGAGTIVGPSIMCESNEITLTNSVTGGSWSSSNPGSVYVTPAGVIFGFSPGAATVSYTLFNGCGSLSATKDISVNPLAVSGTISGSSTLCMGNVATLVNAVAGGVWSSSDPLVASIAGTGLVSSVAPGTVTISYTVTNSCGSASSTFGFTVVPILDAGSISGPSTVCAGSIAIFGETAASGAWSSSAPAIAPINSLGRLLGVSAGTTTISYTVSNDCGIAYATKVVTVNVPGITAIAGPSTVCEGSDIMLSDATPGGTWSSTGVNAGVGGATGVVSGVTAGTAVISYSISNSCGTFTATKGVTVDPLPVAGTVTGAAVVCEGSTTIFADVAPGGSWSSLNSGIAAVGTDGVVTGIAAGTTLISYSVTNGCGTAVASKPMTVNPLPAAGVITGIPSACAGGTTTLGNVAPGGVWSSLNTGVATISGTGLVSALVAGTSDIYYTVTNGCGTAASTATMTVNLLPGAGTITGAGTVCEGSSIVLTDGVPGGTWVSSNTTAATIDASGVVTAILAGTTNITYTVNNGCGTATAAKTIIVNPLPVAGSITGAGLVCVGTVAYFTNTVTGGTWSSSYTPVATVGIAGAVTGHVAGTSTLSYTVNNSCGTAAATLLVTVNLLPSAGIITGPSSVCNGNSITFANATTGGTWSSSTSSVATVGSTGIVTAIAPGTVQISYTTTNVCGNTSTARTVTVIAIPSAITGPIQVCPGASILLESTTLGGTYTGTNSAATVYNLAPGTARVTGIAPGTTTISYTTLGCTATTTISVNPLPVVGAVTGPYTGCTGSTIMMTNTTTGGAWSSSDNAVLAVDGTGVVTGTSAGTARVSYTVSNSCGNAYASQIITIYPIPVAGTISGPTIVCAGSTISLAHTAPGTAWSSSNSSVANVSTLGVVTGLSGGTTTISYNVSNGCGSVFAEKIVTVNPLPAAGIITGALQVCVGSTTTLTGTMPGGIWESSDASSATVSSTGVVEGISAAAVYISYTTANACGNTTIIRVHTVNPLPYAGIITGTDTICPGNTTTLTDAYVAGTWSSSNPAVAWISTTTATVTGVTAGTTTISYSTTSICGTAAATKVITVKPPPNAGIIAGSSTVCAGSSTTITSNAAYGLWTSSNTAVATINVAGVITGIAAGSTLMVYTVSNSCGTQTATKNITVLPMANAGAISGPSTVCEDGSITVSNYITGGAWSSSNTVVATISSAGIVTGVTAGTATISYTTNNSCGTATALKALTVLPAPAAITGAMNVCKGATTTLVNATSGGSWSSSSPIATIDAATGLLTSHSTGTTTISYTLLNGCHATTMFTVSPQPEGIAGTLAICAGTTSALYVHPAISAAGTWSSSNAAVATFGTTGGTVSGIATGTSEVSYMTDAGCYTTTTVTINESPATIIGPTEMCAGTAATLTNTMLGGTWSSSDPGIISIGMLSGVVYAGAAGTTEITYKAGGCSQTVTIAVGRQPAPIAGSLGVCEGSVTILGSIISGGVWTIADTTIATFAAPNGEVKGRNAGTTAISYALGNCASTAIVTVNPLPNAITGPATICTGQTATLSFATPGGLWSSASSAAAVGLLSGIVTGLFQGTATIWYTLPTGCRAPHDITVNTSPGPIYGSLLICEGSATALSAASATTGTWESSNTAIATAGIDGLITGISQGTSTISVIIPTTGCFATTTVSVNPLPSAISGVTDICNGASATFTTASAGGAWSSSAPGVAAVDITTGIVNGISPGEAIITYKLSPNCITTKSITIKVLPAAITGTMAACVGSATTLLCTPAGGTWSGSNDIATIDPASGIVTGDRAGNTMVTYSAPNGCSATTMITINPLPEAISGELNACIGATTIAENTVAGGTWSSTNTNVAEIGSDDGIILGIAVGTTIISYVLNTGCLTTTVVTVNAPPGPISGPSAVCEGAAISLTCSPSGGTWSSASIVVSVANVPAGTVVGLRSGTAIITYTLAQGCSAYANILVNPLPDPGAITGNTSICAWQTTTLLATTSGGNWTSSDPGIAAITGPGKVIGASAGTAIISCTKTNACGSRSATKVVTVYDVVNAGKITGPDIVCMGNTITLTATAINGIWSSSDTSTAIIAKDGKVKGINYGTGQLMYIVSNLCSADTARHTISLRPSEDCMPDWQVITEIKIYPNPNNGAFTLETPVAGTFKVFTTDSRLVTQYPITGWITHLTLPPGLAKGIYFCSFVGYEGTNVMFKLVHEP